jgi:hypothetical protein
LHCRTTGNLPALLYWLFSQGRAVTFIVNDEIISLKCNFICIFSISRGFGGMAATLDGWAGSGKKLCLRIKGSTVATAEDETLTGGQFGLAVVSLVDEPADCWLNDIVMIEP